MITAGTALENAVICVLIQLGDFTLLNQKQSNPMVL
jgi:hypothetical protein